MKTMINSNYIKIEYESCKCGSKKLFKCGKKRKCLECGYSFESELEFKAYAKYNYKFNFNRLG